MRKGPVTRVPAAMRLPAWIPSVCSSWGDEGCLMHCDIFRSVWSVERNKCDDPTKGRSNLRNHGW